MPKTTAEQERPELVEARQEAESRHEMETLLEGSAHDMQELSYTLEADLQKIEGDLTSEAEELRTGLFAIQQEVIRLEKGFWQKVAEAVSSPVQYVKRLFEARRERALQIPDNEKVIDNFDKRIRKIHEKMKAFKKRLPKDVYGEVKLVAYPDDVVEDIYAISAEYTRAAKKDEQKWRRIASEINQIAGSQIRSFLPSHKLYESYPDLHRDKFTQEVQDNLEKCIASNAVLVDPLGASEEYDKAKQILRQGLVIDRVDNSPTLKRLRENGASEQEINQQKKQDEYAMMLEFPDINDWRLRAYYGDTIDPEVQFAMMKKILESGNIYPLSKFHLDQWPPALLRKLTPEDINTLFTAYKKYSNNGYADIIKYKHIFHDQLLGLSPEEVGEFIEKFKEADIFYLQDFFSVVSLPNSIEADVEDKVLTNPTELIMLRNADRYELNTDPEKRNAIFRAILKKPLAHVLRDCRQLILHPDIYQLTREKAVEILLDRIERFVVNKESNDELHTYKQIFSVVRAGVLNEEEIALVKEFVRRYTRDIPNLLRQMSSIDTRRPNEEFAFFLDTDPWKSPYDNRELAIHNLKGTVVTGHGFRALFSLFHEEGRSTEKNELFTRFIAEAAPEEMWESFINNSRGENLAALLSEKEKLQMFEKILEGGVTAAATLLFTDEQFMFAHFTERQIASYIAKLQYSNDTSILRKFIFGVRDGQLSTLLAKEPSLIDPLKDTYFKHVSAQDSMSEIKYTDHAVFSEEEYRKFVDAVIVRGSSQEKYDLLLFMESVEQNKDKDNEQPAYGGFNGGFGGFNGGFGKPAKIEKKSLLPYKDEIVNAFIRDAYPHLVLELLVNGRGKYFFSEQQVTELCAGFLQTAQVEQIYRLYQHRQGLPKDPTLLENIKQSLVEKSSVDFALQLLRKDFLFVANIDNLQQASLVEKIQQLFINVDVMRDIKQATYPEWIKKSIVESGLRNAPESLTIVAAAVELFPETAVTFMKEYAGQRAWGAQNKNAELQLMLGYVRLGIVDSRDATQMLNLNSWQVSELPDQFLQFLSAAEFHPWYKGLEQLQKVQAYSSRVEHCPWAKELMPLLKWAKEKGCVSFEKPEDADLLTAYVQEYGAYNMPTVFELYAEVKQGKTMKDILANKDLADKIGSFFGKDKLKKIQDGNELMNEIKKAKRAFQRDLLADVIPGHMSTALGEEIFNALRGSSRWGRGHGLSELVETWKQTVASNPDTAKLPEHYEEETFAVSTIKEVTAEPEEMVKAKTEIVENKNVVEQWKRIAMPFKEISTIPPDATSKWYADMVDNLSRDIESQIRGLQAKLESLPEQGKRGTMANIQKMEEFVEAFRLIDIGSMEGGDFSDVLDQISKIAVQFEKDKKLRSIADDVLLRLSALHMKQIAPHGHGEHIQQFAHSAEKPDEQSLSEYADFMTQYVVEHYLNDQQVESHTGHKPFSKETMKKMAAIWQVEKDLEKGNALVQAAKKLEQVNRGKSVKSGAKRNVSFVPVRGMMRIFAGDVGDACYTSKHQELAKGEFPGLTAVMMVTNRDSAQERMEGSVLLIETKTAAKDESVLIVRANNPRANMFGKTDPDALIKATLDYAIDIAKKRGIDKVVVPRDSASASCSNRSEVAAYYQQEFKTAPSVLLVDEPETNFNGYAIWTGTTVEVWKKEDVVGSSTA